MQAPVSACLKAYDMQVHVLTGKLFHLRKC